MSTAVRPMSVGDAAAVILIGRYGDTELGADRIEAQRLLYLLKSAGVPLDIRFTKGCYGPYSADVGRLAGRVNGCSFPTSTTGAMSTFEISQITMDAAESVLSIAPDAAKAVEAVLALAEGFESTYGLELLCGVYWLATEDGCDTRSKIIENMLGWAPRSPRLFTRHHIATAIDSLVSHGWLSAEMFGTSTVLGHDGRPGTPTKCQAGGA